jgi:hypothetical protein
MNNKIYFETQSELEVTCCVRAWNNGVGYPQLNMNMLKKEADRIIKNRTFKSTRGKKCVRDELQGPHGVSPGVVASWAATQSEYIFVNTQLKINTYTALRNLWDKEKPEFIILTTFNIKKNFSHSVTIIKRSSVYYFMDSIKPKPVQISNAKIYKNILSDFVITKVSLIKKDKPNKEKTKQKTKQNKKKSDFFANQDEEETISFLDDSD